MWNQERHHPEPPRPLKPSFPANITNLHIMLAEICLYGPRMHVKSNLQYMLLFNG